MKDITFDNLTILFSR